MRYLTSIITGAWLLIVPQAQATIDAALQMQLGNPSEAIADTNNHDHYLIQRPVEALDYSDNLGEPLWASWDLTISDVGTNARSTKYFTDTNLPPNFHRVTTDEYNGVGNISFNRGHLCPSEDRTDTRQDNDAVFYMSNIMPQSAANNSGVWEHFEDYCRALATTNELLILCGPSGFGTSTIPSGRAYIPSNTWKIAVIVPLGEGTALSRLTASNRVVSISVPNVTNGLSGAWQTYVTSPRQIELATGFTFFTAVPDPIASVYRARIDGTPAPAIAGFSPASGATGDSITITGTNFSTASMVMFNGATANFIINSSNTITATIPPGATTGMISIITGGGIAQSTISFIVTSLPVLSIAVSSTNTFIISWQAPSTGFGLQQNPNPATTNWTSVTNAVTPDGNFNQVVVPVQPGNSFFRLSSY